MSDLGDVLKSFQLPVHGFFLTTVEAPGFGTSLKVEAK